MIAPADLEACRAAIRTGSHSFHAASRLLPARVRDPALVLYAFCRFADDAVDEGADKVRAVLRLRDRLDAAYAGRPHDAPADRAFAAMVRAHEMPRALPEALLEGFAWDAEGRRYATLSEVCAYSARVAAAVGAMMCVLMGARAPDTLARACDLGVAMQLTNIARDVGEDARNGRLYLPRDWLVEAGIDPDAWLQAPCFTPAIGNVVQRLLRAADVLYARAEGGIADLPLDCRPAIQSACRVYAEIGHQLEREGLDSVSKRAVVSKGRKIALLAASTGAAFMHSPFGRRPLAPLPEIAYLVDAVQQCEARAAGSGAGTLPRRSFDERMEWATQLHARLIDREQQRAQGRQGRAA